MKDEVIKSLEEKVNWDTALTKPIKYLKNEKITLYHYSDKKLSKLIPIGMNAGNKLSRTPRKSIWLTEHEDEYVLPILTYLKTNYRPNFGTDIYWDVNNIFGNKPNPDGTKSIGVLITKDFFEEHKQELSKFVTYRYKKEFNIRDVSRGTEPTVSEWTYDYEIVPDEVTSLDINGLFKHGALVLATKEQIADAKKTHDELQEKHKGKFIWPYISNYKVDWFKYSADDYQKKRRAAEQKYGVKSYKELHSGSLKEDAMITLHESMFLNEALFSMSSKDFDYPFKDVEKCIKKAKNVYIVSHIKPDQDAIGSTHSLASAIRNKYRDKKVQILSVSINNSIVFEKDDLLILCDIGGSKRIDCNCYKEIGDAIGNNTLNVCRFDHHELEDLGVNKVNIEDLSAGSTCSLVTLFLESQDYEISEQIAKLLFKGIIADTGRMQYSLSKPTLMAIAMLSEHGLNYEKIYADMYMQSPKSIKAKQYLLSHYEQSSNGVIYCLLKSSLGKSNGFDAGEAAAMVHELSGIKGCPIWITAYEVSNNEIRCRVRSRGIDLRGTCKKFNGGGHEHACGVVVRSREQLARLIAELDKLIELSKFAGRFNKLNEGKDMEDNKDYLKKYDEYLIQHIGNVQKAYKILQEVVEIPEDIKAKLDKNIRNHDKSKYSDEEYEPYALYFNVDKDLYEKEFNYAWLHHIHANPHHWQHWMLQHEDEGLELMQIPEEYIYEMICDWLAFSVKAKKLNEIQKWYAEHRDGIQMNDKSRKIVEGILAKLASYDFDKNEKIKNILEIEPKDALIESNYADFNLI